MKSNDKKDKESLIREIIEIEGEVKISRDGDFLVIEKIEDFYSEKTRYS